MANYGDFQLEIYRAGLSGERPAFPVTFAELEQAAHQALSPELTAYVAGGAGNEHTQNLNVAAFDRWGLYPRVLRGSSQRDLGTELFGIALATPLLLAPIGVIGLCAPDGHGDLATAQAAARTGVPMIASTLTVDPMEDVAAAFGDTPGFFQLYTPTDRELAESFVRRAERAGFSAIFVTLDTTLLGWRPRDLRIAHFPQMRGLALENYYSDPVFLEMLDSSPAEDPGAAANKVGEVFGSPTLSWEDLRWLRSITKLPLVVKGAVHPDDVRRAIDAGVDAVYCSNHGGRQANGGIASIELLPDVVAAAGETPVIFDSGVRGGEHVVKALALGARAVAIGRPYAYGLAIGGADGIVHVIRSLLAETDLLMAIDGYGSLADLTPEALMDRHRAC